MIEPVLSDKPLIDEVQSTRPAPGQVAVWWLGQSGLLVKSRLAVVLIDPYLSESLTAKYRGTTKEHTRMTRCPLQPELLTMLDVICCTHKHSDHMDPGTLPGLMQVSPGARLILPESLVEHAQGMGLSADRLVGLDHDGGYEDQARNLKIRAIRAAHEGLDQDENGRYLYLSFLVELDGVRLFHSGDTVPWPGQAEAVGTGVDLAFLPINGRDVARGVPGNMTADEAVDFAVELRAGVLVPHHYDMFTFNTVDISSFHQAAQRLPKQIRPLVTCCGGRVFIGQPKA